MLAGYVHVEVELAQSSKKTEAPCGDVFASDRNVAATTLLTVDGIGSGIRAHIAAEMAASRLMTLLRSGFSLRKAFAALVRSMQNWRDPTKPFAAFTMARILNDGMTTVLGYEAPGAVLVSQRHAAALPQNPLELGGVLVAESNCYLEPGDGLLLMSDGVTQAGLGGRCPEGWKIEGVVRFANDRLVDGVAPAELPTYLHREARNLWGDGGDDCTVALAWCRRGQIVNLFTGPPAHRGDDARAVRRFMQQEGLKIVCGGTTAEIVAQTLKRPIAMEQDPASLIAPPRFSIEGVDLVTEGAVTLNQVYNLLDEDIRSLREDSGVTELCALLQIADRVNIFQGQARNRAAGDISFRQQGILTRDRIVPLLVEKLRALDKLVVVQTV